MKSLILTHPILLMCLQAHAGLADDLRAVAGQIPFLEASQILYDRAPSQWNRRLLSNQEAEAVLQFRQLVHQATVAQLRKSLQDPDAKVRALAICGLHWHGAEKQLPDLVGLAGDQGAAIPWRAPRAYALVPLAKSEDDLEKLREKESFEPQTVGSYAKAVVKMYMRASGFHYGIEGYRDHPGFQQYWNERKDRTYCLGWFRVALQRASQGTSPARQELRDKVNKLRQQINALPSPDREWILLALATPWEGGSSEPGGAMLASEADLIAAGKRLGPKRIMTLFEREPISTDPDLQLPGNGTNGAFPFARVVLFLLRNARELFDQEQADQLLKLEQKAWQRKQNGQSHWVTPRWAIAAADLRPDRAATILHRAMQRYSSGTSTQDQDNRHMIAVALWEHEGQEAIPKIADWFFTDTPDQGAVGFGRHRMARFLQAPQQKALLKALLADPRLSRLDWGTLERLARSANQHAPEPVLSEEELRRARHPLGSAQYSHQKAKAKTQYPEETAALEARLAEWREKLKEFAKKL